MIVDFEGVPGVFVEVYREAFAVWGREFQKRGRRCAIVFNPVPGVPTVLGPDGQPVQRGAWLEAEVERAGLGIRVIIRPASDHDAEMILRHVREMRGQVLQ